MNAPSEEIYSKFPIEIVTVAALLTVCELRYFQVQRLKIAIFTYGIVIVDPLAEERPAIYQRNLCIADSYTCLSSFVLPLLPL